MVALRYVYVLALSVWFGGIITIGAIVAPVSGVALHRFFLTSYLAGSLVLDDLVRDGAARPASLWVLRQVRVAVAMLSFTLYAGLHLRSLPVNFLAPIAIGGLMLLFWEARDGTRAASGRGPAPKQ